jgi:fermentation-respiration switch protein FrsA (DUF1100 family)
MRVWLHAVLALALASTTGCASSRLANSSLDDLLVYYPMRYPIGQWNPKGLTFEDVWFMSADGAKLHGWYCPHPNPRAVVLVAHGNAGNITYFADTMRMLQSQLGVTAMIFDYRGYGRSVGIPTEQGVLADARAARTWLSRRTGVAPRDIVLLGRSLGGGVMVDLAAQDGARALILESTFTSLPDVAATKVPRIPVHSIMRNRYESVSKIGRYCGPLLQSHGDADPLIPIEQARRLFVAANEPKWFVTIPGAKHNWVPTQAYVAELDRFLGVLPPTHEVLSARQ